mmetsp:Transcript_21313/g.33349  ORF Transcript_21313/g.33349 Transcript_21313/m.33349 type:complete len:207 (+) Transcript_21313:3-623(+)
MIDARFLHSILGNSVFEHLADPHPVTACATKEPTLAVIGVHKLGLPMNVRDASSDKDSPELAMDVKDILVVYRLPVPLHLSEGHPAFPEGMTMRISLEDDTKLNAFRFPSEYQDHPYWTSEKEVLPWLAVGRGGANGRVEESSMPDAWEILRAVSHVMMVVGFGMVFANMKSPEESSSFIWAENAITWIEQYVANLTQAQPPQAEF